MPPAMMRPTETLATHLVANQPEMAGPLDPWADDVALREQVGVRGAGLAPLAALGRAMAEGDAWALGEEARRALPELRAFDRGGRRLDEVRFSPAYHALMAMGLEAGYAGLPWAEGPDLRSGGHAAHAAMVYMMTQAEPGVCCPMTMTYAAVPALRAAPRLAALWGPRLAAAAYDPSLRPVGDKVAATMGMAMTEKQGGSDLRANRTSAVRDGEGWRLAGHKWFCSAPMSDGFLVLAQAPGGLSCFLLPRWLLDGTRNALRLVRLKAKMGNTANASAEVELEGAWAELLGGEGDGVRTVLAMVHHTRLDTAMAPAGLMRAALREAHRWCEGRQAFGGPLIDKPLMRAVLADLALDWEGALALGLRVAQAFDRGEAPFARVAVALAKFLANKRCVSVTAEAMEALGGMGYVEDTPMPTLYREAPLNGIWEGSGNVICLDVLRTLARERGAAEALDAELDGARGLDRGYDAALGAHRAGWSGPPEEGEARLFAEGTALLLQAAALLGSAPEVGAAFVRGRLTEERGREAGAVRGLPIPLLLDRMGSRHM